MPTISIAIDNKALAQLKRMHATEGEGQTFDQYLGALLAGMLDAESQNPMLELERMSDV